MSQVEFRKKQSLLKNQIINEEDQANSAQFVAQVVP